jgi:hypothetical protein
MADGVPAGELASGRVAIQVESLDAADPGPVLIDDPIHELTA